MRLNRITIALRNVLVLHLLGALPSACSAPVEDSQGGTQAPVEFDVLEEGLAVPTEFYWDQYLGRPTVMWPQSAGYCFLTGLRGKFRGLGEQVHVTASNGNWILTGKSGQVDVGGWAHCVPWQDVAPIGQYFFWGRSMTNSGTCQETDTCAVKDLKADYKYFCSLSGVSGRMMHATPWSALGSYAFGEDGDLVDLQRTPYDRWFALAEPWSYDVRGWKPVISVEAQCLSPLMAVETYEYSFGQQAQGVDLGTISAKSICTISGISGSFNGGGEYVRIYTDGKRWILDQDWQSGNGINARFSCLYRY